VGGGSVKTLKELRKSKKLTMGKLAELSGVSAKTISQYEQSPPVRPSRKVVGKISDALAIDTQELLSYLSPQKRRKGAKDDEGSDSIMLEDSHVIRLLRLLDKEMEELQYLMVDCANLAEDHPALSMCIDTVSADIALLTEIKGRFQG
jgi:transcriptional regulator with XRE-family HTH domain